MKWEAILATIRSLAGSQGSYGRMLRAIEEMDGDKLEAVKSTLEAQNFQGPVDLVMFLET